MYEWVVNRLRNAEAEHTKHGEDKLAVLCRDAANAVVALNMHSGLTEAMHHLFWRAMIDERWCADCDTEPTHWMPLPEPPKEEA